MSHDMDGASSLLVAHDEDGDWQFLCAADHDEEGEDRGRLACLECMVSGDLSLNEVAGMDVGLQAERAGPDEAWVVSEPGLAGDAEA